ncbi:MAG: GTP 3',8-cyclase MoaA [Planctomycetota bacterium]|nr:MAG: GTP 3',8-cyclase MoaA [Planctomycetota bacterium]
MRSLRDRCARPLRNLRLSVTDRCNLRCAYCMPEEEYVWLPRRDILRFEEILALVRVFAGLGVDKLRLTGGEPLLRRELPALVAMLAGEPRLRDLAMTTNGVLLAEHAAALRAAGLHRVTVSLDTLRRERFRALTRRDDLAAVLAGVEAAQRAGFRGTKLDSVLMRGVNDDELEDLLDYARAAGAELRYIEYMDVGGATRWSPEHVVARAEILERLRARYGAIEPLREDTSAPAQRFRLPDGTTFGIIASVTAPFCSSCDRSRLTADGMWYLCLYAAQGVDLRGPLRAGASPEELAERVRAAWSARADRGAEARLAARHEAPLLSIRSLREDPHLEMHTRGG